MSQNFYSGNVSTAIDTQRVLEVKILNRLNAMGTGGGTGGSGVTGTGSPEGVVTATAGTLYTDTTTPGAAIVWIKTSGSGNTGWERVIG